MEVKYVSGRIEKVNDSYALRLIEQGKAVSIVNERPIKPPKRATAKRPEAAVIPGGDDGGDASPSPAEQSDHAPE